jgi:hypothetical protein
VSTRLRRVEKLVDFGQEAVNAARATAVAAAHAVAEARSDVERNERSWSDAAKRFGTGVTRSPDIDQQAAHLGTLRLVADASARGLQVAIAEERRCAAAVVKAAMEHRKLELWRDRIVQAESDEESRRERRDSDELAARVARARA